MYSGNDRVQVVAAEILLESYDHNRTWRVGQVKA